MNLYPLRQFKHPISLLAKLQPFVSAYRPHDEIPDCGKLGMERIDQVESSWDFIKSHHQPDTYRSWMALTCPINPSPPVTHNDERHIQQRAVSKASYKSHTEENVGEATVGVWNRLKRWITG